MIERNCESMPMHETAVTVSSMMGVVIIGRNEGDRLKRCLESVASATDRLVYVDSGSSDGSAEWARKRGAIVVELDQRKPFTAARARNEGFHRLCEAAPDLTLVQFIDGDCEIAPGWLLSAEKFLAAQPRVAAVCGRLSERFPERSVYNLLCDMEWNGPVGEVRAVGGNAMMQRHALTTVGGYRDDLVAGEEPELCVRLRAGGWTVWRIADHMGWHDAAMTRFGQWWTRAVRAGHAYAQGASLHGAPPERLGAVESRRALLWGLALPVSIVGLAMLHPAGLALAAAYPLQALRLALRDGIARSANRWRALFLVLARFPEAQGVLKFWRNRLCRRPSGPIAYK